MLRIAKVLKSNGVDGDVLVSAPDVALEDLQGPVLIDFDGLPAPFFIESCSRKGTGKYVIHLTDVCNLEDAEELVGRFLMSDEVEEEDDAVQDFTGWKVLNRGDYIGTVTDYEPIPGNLCLYLKPAEDADEIIIPLHEDLIISIDEDSLTLNLNLPDGLL
mgnify:FL=1